MAQAVANSHHRALRCHTLSSRGHSIVLPRYQALASTSSSFVSSNSLDTTYGYARATDRHKLVVIAGNKGSTGPFAPLVVALRNAMGTKEFNQLRGKAISLHSQVIKEFGSAIGADIRQVQGLIRLAKKNGEKLGFLA